MHARHCVPHLAAGISSRVKQLPGPALPLPGLCAVPHDKCTVVSCRWVPLQLQAAGLHTWRATGSAVQQLAPEKRFEIFPPLSPAGCRAARQASQLHVQPAGRRHHAVGAGSGAGSPVAQGSMAGSPVAQGSMTCSTWAVQRIGSACRHLLEQHALADLRPVTCAPQPLGC